MTIDRWQKASLLVVYPLIFLALSARLLAQADTASIDGTVMDASGAVVPSAELVLTSVQTGVERKTSSGPDGLYSFPTVQAGDYQLRVAAQGFRILERTGISLRPNQRTRLDVSLEVGALTETVTVSASVNPLNFENATQETGVGPEVLNKLPLIVAGGSRNIVSFALLVPGVNNSGTGSASSVAGARVNGSMAEGDNAVLDGTTMSKVGGNSGFVNMEDYRLSPDMVSEYRLITSNYEPHWGASSGSQLVVKTKSGTAEYHGGIFEYHRNTVLNARPWSAPFRPRDTENDYGGFIGGPIPGLNRGNVKTFGYFLFEGFRIVGGVNLPTLTIPSLKQRVGDFTDWVDGSGRLIPIYDPATTRSDGNGGLTRDQFNCNGVPNIICPSRIANSLANEWFQHLPNPTSSGAINNFVPPKPQPIGQANNDYYLYKVDHYPGTSDHFSLMVWDNNQSPERTTFLPPIIDNKSIFSAFKNIFRVNWDHTFSPTLLNTFNFGWTHVTWDEASLGADFANQLPQIQGVQSHASAPTINFTDGFAGFTHPGGPPQQFPQSNVVYNNLTTWVKGKHTIKFGGEYWSIRYGNPLGTGLYGEFSFARPTTGLLGVTSGSPIASFLLEHVSTAQSQFTAIDEYHTRQDTFIGHIGDTWKLTPKFTLNIGLRWDMHRPAWERDNRFSFLDLNRPNPGAGGRLGALAFAGDEWGAASFGSRYPEDLFRKGFGPRLGMAYAMNEKTVVRAGYGIFYSASFYPSWTTGVGSASGAGPDGFTSGVAFDATQGGLTPSMILSEGFPQNFTPPPFIDPTFRNGQTPFYRAFDGNRLPYSAQWNLTIERQLAGDANVSIAYVANKGTRLLSGLAPINTLDPSLLSMGPRLRDEFGPGMTELHGVPLPYEGWIDQLGCAPSVAQALLPYPQYCSTLRPTNENAANSTYHSFQFKFEKNLSRGMFLLTSYTWSKMITDGGNVQINGAINEVYSPFERHRAKSLAQDDIPHNLTVGWVYELPFGQGRRYSSPSGVLNTIVGGWTVSGIFRATSGNPYWVRSVTCNVPSQFRASCVPALLPGADPYLQDIGSFDPARGPLFNEAAFEPVASFGEFGYYGAGPRILPNVRQPGLKNTDISVYKDTKITEKLNLQLRFEFFNILNNHYFAASARFAGVAFNRNLGSPNFGNWTGAITNPRNIQLGIRLQF